jgi:hypothetical protein
VIGLAFGREGRTLHAGLGDGTVRLGRLAAPTEEWLVVEAHDGAVLSLCADVKDGALTGGDDGRLLRIAPDGAVQELARYGSRWVEHVASHESGLRACAVAKAVHLLDGGGKALKSLAHPSSVGGIAFDAKGKRVAASRYNGAYPLVSWAARGDNRPLRGGRNDGVGQPPRHSHWPRRRHGDGMQETPCTAGALQSGCTCDVR